MTVIQSSPTRVLYPVGPSRPGEAAVCWNCFQPRTDLATTADPRIADGELVRTCLSCFHALASGRPVELPPREQLPELLRSWARWAQNGEVDEDFTTRMLAALLPGLPAVEAASWFECLQGALLELQDRDSFGFELLSVEPEARDVEALVADSIEKVDECVAALMGGAL
jgi:hypothetical protein